MFFLDYHLSLDGLVRGGVFHSQYDFISGQYQCRLFDGESSFLQESNQRVRLGITPTIRVVPRRNTIVCEVGQEVSLQCSVQEPYRVVFSNISDSGTTQYFAFLKILQTR